MASKNPGSGGSLKDAEAQPPVKPVFSEAHGEVRFLVSPSKALPITLNTRVPTASVCSHIVGFKYESRDSPINIAHGVQLSFTLTLTLGWPAEIQPSTRSCPSLHLPFWFGRKK